MADQPGLFLLSTLAFSLFEQCRLHGGNDSLTIIGIVCYQSVAEEEVTGNARDFLQKLKWQQ